MSGDSRLAVRPANPGDRSALLSFTRFEDRVHVHLDWKPVEDWLGAQPFLLAERRRRLVAALACPPDPPDTAWLRLFCAIEELPLEETWDLLWERASAMLRQSGARTMAVLCMDRWVADLCARTPGFEQTHAVVVLSRSRSALRDAPAPRAPVSVRLAHAADREAIIAADQAAFASPWQMSAEVTASALARSDYLTVADLNGQVVGYQLSTPSPAGAHLARLAVLPAHQGQGIGFALVANLIDYYNRRGAREITVNTQDTNTASLAVYHRLGFAPTGATYPVFQTFLGAGSTASPV
jgi:ribosomal-protein-alanine N-acetyltransferase